MNGFKIIKPEEITDNTFKLIGSDWMLITAGARDAYNMMTASWGGLGVLWNKNICWCVVRPQRHTYGFMEKADYFTLSFFGEEHRKALEVCGSKSGRDIDKAAVTGLTPIAGTIDGTTTFTQARLVIECRKIYFHDLDPAHFLDSGIEVNYPDKDYHRMYVGKIVNCLTK
ncbi:MAG: flavin reductase [Armatimonadota bacterium]|nr:flavin reductase [bacterium]